MFKCQAEEIVRRCEAGFSPEAAVNKTIDLEAVTKKSTDRTKVRLDTSALKGLKHDVNALKQIADLREKTKAGNGGVGWQGDFVAERREARKQLRRLAREENRLDEIAEQEMKEIEEQEMKELMGSKLSDTAQPSLFVTAEFLIVHYAQKLPQEVCQACDQCVFHDSPEAASMCEKSHNRRPMRSLCGHWLHYECLDTWLTTPPFVRNCQVCGRRIWHPDWPEDIKRLEKAWQSKETKKREMSDVADMMGF